MTLIPDVTGFSAVIGDFGERSTRCSITNCVGQPESKSRRRLLKGWPSRSGFIRTRGSVERALAPPAVSPGVACFCLPRGTLARPGGAARRLAHRPARTPRRRSAACEGAAICWPPFGGGFWVRCLGGTTLRGIVASCVEGRSILWIVERRGLGICRRACGDFRLLRPAPGPTSLLVAIGAWEALGSDARGTDRSWQFGRGAC